MGENSQEKVASTQVFGDALLNQLREEWAPLPGKTVIAMALGALKVRMMRSTVTMLSIVLAIAFLTYTGLTSYLQKNLISALPRYTVTNPALPADVRKASDALLAVSVIEGLDTSGKLALAKTLGIDDATAAITSKAGIAGQIAAAQEQANKAKKNADDVAANKKSLKSEIASAQTFAAKSEEAYKATLADEKQINQSIALAEWVGKGTTANAGELEPLLKKVLSERLTYLVKSLPNPAKLSATELTQLTACVALIKSKGAPADAVAMAEKSLVDEGQRRNQVDLQTLMRSAGVSMEVTDSAKRMEVWLIVMALLTCAVGIANAMLMSVTERFREIGTMKCLGAQDNLVVKLFLLESGLLGIFGALLGILLGLGVALLAASLQFRGFGFSEFPGVTQGSTVIGLSVLGGLFLSVGGAVYPAYAASRMRPVDALRVDE